ncbi:MAG TPA: metal-sulfur cluster assembly factor [Actinomycetota bacterium]|jgi:metal-sulfur cluster biosynthetic enzyme|nr:metal-sulfur cluster assembly factor [Actinomycetota bacterium]
MSETKTINEEEVWEVLKVVTDPEIGIDVVNLGLVYGIDIEDSTVKVRMTLTSMGCPATGLIEFQAKEAVGTVDGVDDVVVEFTFDPPWSPDRMTEEGRDMLQAMGY